MANAHSLLWRKPGRRNAERRKFRRLMQEVEAIRFRNGMTMTELAAELKTATDALRALDDRKSHRAAGDGR
jgi:predicted SprT family Zn-dependent metalloprotease